MLPQTVKGNGPVKRADSFSSPAKRRYFGRRNLKDQPHHERILIEGIKKVENLQGYCSDFSSSINNWYEKFCEFHDATEDLSQCFLSVYRGTKERMESAVTSYSKEVDNTKNRKLPKLKLQIEKFSTELAHYSYSIQVQKDWMEARNKMLVSFNHYSTKCAGLKVKQDKCKDAGKLETSKQKEKMKRNQEKLGEAKAAFFKRHQEVIESLHHRWDTRFSFLDDFVNKVISNELMFFESYTKSLQSTKQILENAMKQAPNHPEPSPGEDQSKKKWDFPDDVPISDSAQLETSTSSEANNKNKDSTTFSEKGERGQNSALTEGEGFLPFRKSMSPICALEGTPKKSKRKKTKTLTPCTPKSAPVAVPSNPFASSPKNFAQDPFIFLNGEPDHSEITSKRKAEQTPTQSRQKRSLHSGEKVRSGNQTRGCNDQNPFELGSTENIGSPDPFQLFFEENK